MSVNQLLDSCLPMRSGRHNRNRTFKKRPSA
jgi:hypothetical protein